MKYVSKYSSKLKIATSTSESELKQFYQKYWLRRIRDNYIYDALKYPPRYPIIVKLVGRNKRVLDVGCGEGILSMLLQRLGNVVIGIDLSEEAVKLSRNNGIEAYICDIENEDLPFDKKFDVIILSEVLEHVVFPKEVIRKLKNNLDEKGYFVITFPNIGFYVYRLQLLLGRFPKQGLYDQDEHLHYWALPDFLLFLKNKYRY
ncbi:MAG: methyltransferase domain-containing protein [Nitrososphaerota archaeon]